MDNNRYFQGRTLVVASQHDKESVIAPRLSKAFSLRISPGPNVDTDALGTFSGEVDRLLSPIDAARAKCQKAMDLTGCDLAIASEASFGPHPIYPFVAAHEELLLMQDRKNEWEFVVKTLETNTNYHTWSIRSREELKDILEPSQFPSHALIVKKSASDASHCVKGIQSNTLLEETVEEFLQRYSICQVETDMRAMHNPTRMQVIARLTDQLIEQINTSCPQCHVPGFRISDIIRGLPCAICDQETRGIRAEVYTCSQCLYVEQRKKVGSPEKEDPMYCDYCNP